MTRGRFRRALVVGALGTCGVVGAWWLLALFVFTNAETGRRTLPTPPEVIAEYAATGIDFYVSNFSITLAEAARGYALGVGAAVLSATVVLIAPKVERVVLQLATITYCLPLVAIGGLAVVVIGAPSPGDPSGAAVFLSALSVYFITTTTMLVGLRAADSAALDVVAVFGGSRVSQLLRVRVIAAVPSIVAALRIAVPAALLGAVIGEFFGKVEYGVGPAMIIAQQNLASDRLWGIALAIALVASVGFAIIGAAGRLVAPWTKGSSPR